jgi:hypothetical protein
MKIEDRIAEIIKDEYAFEGYEDEGRSGAAAHDIVLFLRRVFFHVWDDIDVIEKQK